MTDTANHAENWTSRLSRNEAKYRALQLDEELINTALAKMEGGLETLIDTSTDKPSEFAMHVDRVSAAVAGLRIYLDFRKADP